MNTNKGQSFSGTIPARSSLLAGNFCQRWEIMFWMRLISLMKKWTLRRYSLAALFLGLGILLSLFSTAFLLFGVQRTSHPVYLPAVIEQHNVLLVIVDQMPAPEPRLKGVWLVVSYSSQPSWTLLPVYPVEVVRANARSDLDDQLELAFGLVGGQGMKAPFSQALHERGLWWNDYMIIDQAALVALLDQANGADLGMASDRRASGVDLEAYLALADESQTALLGQATLLRNLCDHTTQLFRDVDPAATLGHLNQHIRTSYAEKDLTGYWYRMRQYGHGLTCELPTLQEAAEASLDRRSPYVQVSALTTHTPERP